MRGVLLALLAVLVLAAPAAAAPPKVAGYQPDLGGRPVSPALPVPGRALEPKQVIATARAVPEVVDELEGRSGVRSDVFVSGKTEWRVVFSARDGEDLAQITIDDRTGKVTEVLDRIQVHWPLARGIKGAIGGTAGAPPIWLLGLLLFLAPFLRPPWRMLHLDLAVLASLSISFAFFSRGQIDVSVPLAYPPLLYLLWRMLRLARAGRSGAEPLKMWDVETLAMGIAFLVSFRIAMQIAGSNVIDVGYAGVIGADKLSHLSDLYGSFPPDNPHGDTYGPLLYLFYVPFELLMPWNGRWGTLPSAHVAATFFDFAAAAGLVWVGRRRSLQLGLLLGYLWLAFPFTLVTANSGANDALVGLLVLAAVTWRSGALAAAAGLTKFVPLILVPMLVRSWRSALAVAAVLAAGALAVLATDGGFGDFWTATFRFQLDRDSPFSIWGLYDLGALHIVATVIAAAFGLAASRIPHTDRHALAAAVLLLVQITAGYWFYTYIDWVLPLILVALLRPFALVTPEEEPPAAPPRSKKRAAAPKRSARARR